MLNLVDTWTASVALEHIHVVMMPVHVVLHHPEEDLSLSAHLQVSQSQNVRVYRQFQ